MRPRTAFLLLACSVVIVSDFAHAGGTSTTTTSSTSTTVATTSTTSTTLPPDPCVAIPAGATFASIVCRLDLLEDRVTDEDALGAFQAKLLKAVDKAKTRAGEGEVYCIGADAKRAGKRLKKVGRALIQFSHRLRSRAARKKLTEDVREPLALEADAINADAQTLRDALVCPPGEG